MNRKKAVERIDRFLEVMVYTRDRLEKINVDLKKKTAYHYRQVIKPKNNKEEQSA